MWKERNLLDTKSKAEKIDWLFIHRKQGQLPSVEDKGLMNNL